MKTKFLILSGLKIHYQTYKCSGKPNGNLIFLHGGASEHRMYEEFLKYFQNDFNVYTFTYPGFGLSATLRNFTVENLVNIVHEFITNFKLQNVLLMGHSFGGGLALQYTLKYKDVKGMVLITPLVSTLPTSLPVTLKNMIWHRFIDRKTVGLTNVGKLLKNNGGSFFKHALNSSKLFRFVRTNDLGEGIEKLKVPAVVVLGGKDLLLPFEHEQKVLKNVKGLRVIIFPDEGHHLHHTKHREILNALKALL